MNNQQNYYTTQKENSMPFNEKTLCFLEEHIPELADSAIKQAYWQTLATGSSVLESDDGIIYEVFPDGSRKTVKTIASPTPVIRGKRMAL
jgi:hypothetical protein